MIGYLIQTYYIVVLIF